MGIDVKLTEDDLEDLVQFVQSHDPEAPRMSPKYVVFVVLGFLVLWLVTSGRLGADAQAIPRLVWAIVAVTVLMAYFKRRSDPKFSAYVPAVDFSISIERSGLDITTDNSNETLLWEDIEEIIDCERYILVYGEHDQLIVIPKRAFPTQETLTEFWESARTFHIRARYHGGTT